MPKFNQLTNNTLKEILRAHELAPTGNKLELVNRLITELGVDEIETSELNSILSRQNEDTQGLVDNMQRKLDELTQVLQQQQQQSNDTQRKLDQMVRIMENMVANESRRTEERTTPDTAAAPNLNNNQIRPESATTSANSTNGATISPQLEQNEQNEMNTSQMVENAGIRTSMRDVIAVLPEFDPTQVHMTSRKFVDKVENLMRTYMWPENVVLYAVQSKLRGYAKTWLDSQDVFQSWTEFVTTFINDFPIIEDVAGIHIELMRKRQKKEETNLDYYYRVLAIGRRGKLDDRSIIRHCINGLLDEKAQYTLSAMQLDTCSNFLKALSGIVSGQNKPNKVNYEHANKPREHAENAGNTTNFYQQSLRCYNCNEPGHISANCIKPQRKQRCLSCNRVHPKDTICTKEKTVNMIKQLQMFEVPVNIEGRNLVAMIDTGSQSSLIKKSIGEKLLSPKENCFFRILGFCGGSKEATQQCLVDIEICDVKMPINLLLMDDDRMPTEVLIGQDVFEQNKDVQLLIENGVTKIKRIMKVNTVEQTLNETNICCGLNDDNAKTELLNILNGFSCVFSSGMNNIGKTELVTMEIRVKQNEVVYQNPYQVPFPKRKLINEMIDDMLEHDIITTSESVYASPVVLVKKKSGDQRLCVDYRLLNNIILKEHFPLTNVEECLHEAAKFKYYTTLDMNNGYYQVMLEPNSRKFTAFITPDGQYEFKRMPFGLKNAPIVFLRLMAKIRERAGKDTMISYMDDILIGANTLEEMFSKLVRVLKILKEANITLKLSKCEFLKTTIKFLGHELVPDGIKPGQIKTEAINNFKTPETVTEVRQFLGLSGYFRRFVPQYAIIAEPLRRLLRKDEPFKWGDEQQAAFQILKDKLITEPVITAYNVSSEHEIHTDASAQGLAGVLLQNENGTLKPVAFYSRSTTAAERNYHSYELETLAAVETLERFKYYVCGKTVTLVTDCSALKTTMSKSELIPRIARWWLRVQDFELILRHRAGTKMQHVDALSRMPLEKTNEPEVATLRINKTSIDNDDWLMSMQLQDEAVKEIARKLAENDKMTMKDYVLRNGRVFKKDNGKELWLAPKSIRWQLLCENHDKTGHLGVEKTIERLKSYVWFARMRNFCKSYINACVQCAYNKHKGGRTEGKYHYSEPDPVPFRTIHLDHLGPFPKTARRNEHLLVLVDSFSKYTVIKAVKSTATKWVISALNDTFLYFGVPNRIVTDRGSSFTSHQFKQFCNDNDINHILNAVRTPRANGHAERANRTILSMMTTLTENQKHWDQHIGQIQWSLNTMVNATTKKTAHELLFSYTPRNILNNKLLLALDDTEFKDHDTMHQIREAVAENISNEKKKAKYRFDKHHSVPTKYEEGDLVLVENEPTATGTSRKLEPRYKGPFLVKRVLDKDRYVVEDLPQTKRTKRHYVAVYASDKMKHYCKLPTECDEYDTEDSEDA